MERPEAKLECESIAGSDHGLDAPTRDPPHPRKLAVGRGDPAIETRRPCSRLSRSRGSHPNLCIACLCDAQMAMGAQRAVSIRQLPTSSSRAYYSGSMDAAAAESAQVPFRAPSGPISFGYTPPPPKPALNTDVSLRSGACPDSQSASPRRSQQLHASRRGRPVLSPPDVLSATATTPGPADYNRGAQPHLGPVYPRLKGSTGAHQHGS